MIHYRSTLGSEALDDGFCLREEDCAEDSDVGEVAKATN